MSIHVVYGYEVSGYVVSGDEVCGHIVSWDEVSRHDCLKMKCLATAVLFARLHCNNLILQNENNKKN